MWSSMLKNLWQRREKYAWFMSLACYCHSVSLSMGLFAAVYRLRKCIYKIFYRFFRVFGLKFLNNSKSTAWTSMSKEILTKFPKRNPQKCVEERFKIYEEKNSWKKLKKEIKLKILQ